VTYETIPAGEWLERAHSLRADGWWLADLTGLDRLHIEADATRRFDVVVQLLHHSRSERQSFHVAAEGDPPTVPSVVNIWPNARFHERETFDLMGIHFDGHHDLTRIMLPEEWEGHPLRKDYGVGKVTVQFLPQPFLQVDAPGQGTSTIDSGTGVDRLGQSGAARAPEEVEW